MPKKEKLTTLIETEKNLKKIVKRKKHPTPARKINKNEGSKEKSTLKNDECEEIGVWQIATAQAKIGYWR